MCVYEQMTSLVNVPGVPPCPCWVPPPTTHTNDQWDFLRTIAWFIERGGLVRGDILVLDNARIHKATDSREALTGILQLAGVRLNFLPAYSPELNPCELVFSHVKRAMADGRGEGSMWEEALARFLAITPEQMDDWYRHCIMSPLR
jgi:hypothetical protein